MSMSDTIKRKFVLDLKKAPEKPADLTKTRRHALLSNALPHPYDATKIKESIGEGVVKDAIKNVLLGAVFGNKHHGHVAHPKADTKKAADALSKSATGKKERIEPTFDNPLPKSTEPPPADAGSSLAPKTNLNADIAKKFTGTKPEPESKPAATLTLDPKAQKADDDRRKAATKTHGAYQKLIQLAAKTHDPASREKYMQMAKSHGETLKNHEVPVDPDKDLLHAQKPPRLKTPGRIAPPASA